MRVVKVPEGVNIGQLIGKGGKNFKEIGEITGTKVIYKKVCFHHDNKRLFIFNTRYDHRSSRVKRGNLERFLTPINSSTACTPMDHWIYMKVTVHLK